MISVGKGTLGARRECHAQRPDPPGRRGRRPSARRPGIRPAAPPRLRTILYTPYAVAPLSMQAQTTVVVPDGGEALAARYGTYSEGRNEFGVPGLGKLPYAGRGFRNIGQGRTVT